MLEHEDDGMMTQFEVVRANPTPRPRPIPRPRPDGGLKQGPGGLSSNFTGLHFAGLLVVPEQRANCEVRFSREVLPDYLWR